jgi:hypothetical protein
MQFPDSFKLFCRLLCLLFRLFLEAPIPLYILDDNGEKIFAAGGNLVHFVDTKGVWEALISYLADFQFKIHIGEARSGENHGAGGMPQLKENFFGRLVDKKITVV